jgi:hypothetical protein
MARALEQEGFDLRCDWEALHEVVEIHGGRDKLEAFVDVSRRESLLGFSETGEPLDVYPPGDPFAPPGTRPIPAGTVVVRITVYATDEEARPEESWAACDRRFLATGRT